MALVTGGNKGIGLEVCRQLLDLGHRVILTSRDHDRGLAAVEMLGGLSTELHYTILDIGSDDSVKKALNYVSDQFGKLDILINNAGINYDTWQSAATADLQESSDTLNVNLFGAWRTCKTFSPMMIKNGYGRIVNVSSEAGALNHMGGGTPAYSISKAALNVLTIKLAAELSSSGILVNAVCPGWVRTDMGGSNATRSVEEGARSVIWAAILDENGPSGGFFRDGRRLEW